LTPLLPAHLSWLPLPLPVLVCFDVY
jgi:hypothetical protein